MTLHFLVTGHTGFKGSWMILLLKQLGHNVSGISLDPAPGALYESCDLGSLLEVDARIDIRDSDALSTAFQNICPDVVIHLAAQPLVRESYLIPRFTFETNVMGTLNVLEAISTTPSILASVIVTTDKVYRNLNQREGYVESDPLGGDDPYSSSKAMADLLTQSWVTSFSGSPLAIARAGNVIGGGDVSKDRLLVDLVRGFAAAQPTLIRYPDAVRPWQHVLDCLNGYLLIVEHLLSGGRELLWNLGPDQTSLISVRQMANEATDYWPSPTGWKSDADQQPHEALTLMLDSTKARTLLHWSDAIPYPESLHWTLDWYRAVARGADPGEQTRQQVGDYLDRIARPATR